MKIFQNLLFVVAIISFGGCATSSKIQPFNQTSVESNKENFATALDTWIRPQLVKDSIYGWGIAFAEGEDATQTVNFVAKEFNNACSSVGGRPVSTICSERPGGYGPMVICEDSNDPGMNAGIPIHIQSLPPGYPSQTHKCFAENYRYLGGVSTIPHGRILSIAIDSPTALAKYQAKLKFLSKKFEEEGPTGWIKTVDGREAFVRIGDTNYPIVLYAKCCSENSDELTSIDEISTITFQKDGRSVVTMRDGKKYQRETKGMLKQATTANATYEGNPRGSDVSGVPFVVVDGDGLTYFKYISLENLRNDVEISFNDVAAWANKPRTGKKYADYSDYAELKSSNSKDRLWELIFKYKDNDPKGLVEAAKLKREALLAASNSAYQDKLAANQQRLEKKQIGDQVCASASGSINQSTGLIIRGEPQYKQVHGSARFVGFVEKIAGKKVQIRISGINFSGGGINESMDSFSNWKGGSTLKVNNLIWDSVYDWEGC
ncbi:hypothetical protein [Sideroxydans sp.]